MPFVDLFLNDLQALIVSFYGRKYVYPCRGKTVSAKRMMHKFSFRFWCGYLNQPQKYYNDSLSFYFDAFKR